MEKKARDADSMVVSRIVTIDKPPEELYRFWKNFENLPRFMHHLVSVRTLDNARSHWVSKGPAGTTVEWTSELTDVVENERLGWRSVEGSEVYNEGLVQFRRAPGNRGTELAVTLRYHPPGGILGAKVAQLFGEEPSQQVREDLRHLKQLMETGEIPTIEGQPNGTHST